MKKGIDVEDVVLGAGDEALSGKTVVASVRMFLNHGTEVTLWGGPKVKIDLGKRECIPGLRLGIEGMRVGGVRKIVIAPHLAYGARGVPDHVPPNALLRCEVELLDVRDSNAPKPEDYPPGRILHVFHPGEAARGVPRWQFNLEESGRCGASINFPIPGMTSRHTRQKTLQIQLDQGATVPLFQSASALPHQFPADCLTDDRQSNSPCITIGLWERGQYKSYYSMPENSPALLNSELYRAISSLLQPYLVTD